MDHWEFHKFFLPLQVGLQPQLPIYFRPFIIDGCYNPYIHWDDPPIPRPSAAFRRRLLGGADLSAGDAGGNGGFGCHPARLWKVAGGGLGGSSHLGYVVS